MVDLDDHITKRVGRTPAQLIDEEGEPKFRAIEYANLRHLLEIGEAGVIALGGGAWIQEVNRRVLDEYECVSVWLDAPLELWWTRISSLKGDGPLGRTRGQALAPYEQRRPVYELANIHIAIHEEDFEELVSRVVSSFS